ncbi:MAG: hypothetical protein VB030_09545 [Eubacterium aggregans]|uniref:Uncharacterized protein n=1 Tax=Eubacterium aggregans TaxID=81409 RepID=A0A1H4DK31_9FIRM|nr:hypothetical protein [Eubacterium aggregans]MDD4691795.1 hypothetical protein [Eubacterium aggregans]MEA5074406.1 hypothetical protein [Eubacterium aggregans]SEA73131.1 hypothetical protein SAMN04515656_12529 [Eubacterium aggregans]
MKKSKKHLSAISLILIICLLTALFPINALAAVDEQSESSTILSDTDDYSEIYEESIAIAQSFQSIGITPNDLVTILNLPNSVINTSSLGGLYYSDNTRKQLRLAIYYGISQRP